MPLRSRHLLDDGLDYAVGKIDRHSLVISTDIVERDFYYALVLVRRCRGYEDLIVYIADVYTLTAADVHEIVRLYPDVNAIVVISNWDHYSDSAKDEARDYNIGVFRMFEFLEALEFDGERFLDTGIANCIEKQ